MDSTFRCLRSKAAVSRRARRNRRQALRGDEAVEHLSGRVWFGTQRNRPSERGSRPRVGRLGRALRHHWRRSDGIALESGPTRSGGGRRAAAGPRGAAERRRERCACARRRRTARARSTQRARTCARPCAAHPRACARSVEKHSGALTDFEVFRLLDEEKRHAASERQLLSGGRRTAPHVALAAQRIVSAVREGLMRYLSSSPAYVQTEAHIVDFLERTADLGLNAAELLMCINLRPAQRVELFVVRAPVPRAARQPFAHLVTGRAARAAATRMLAGHRRVRPALHRRSSRRAPQGVHRLPSRAAGPTDRR